MASGEPRWLAVIGKSAASLTAGQGLGVSIALAVAVAAIAVGVCLPRPAAVATLVLAIGLTAAIWVIAQALGGILTGTGTDPNSGPLLALLALAYWPAKTMTATPDLGRPSAR